MSENRIGHIRLTSHPGAGAALRFPIMWGADDPRERGPVIGSATADRNVIGAYGGAYSVYRALAVSAGALNPSLRPDLTDTSPVVSMGPFPQWRDGAKIVSLDPWGHLVTEAFKTEIDGGADIRPTIAITRARLSLHEVREAIAKGRLKADGEVVHASGDVAVTKAAIDPVWHLQGGGAGLIVYNRKEGRALGEVTKFLVYNARKRQPGGDQAATYFERTECVAGVQDARFQQLMPDVLHWLGITKIDRFVSMSNMKHEAITSSGIAIGERVPIPAELVPPDASVELEAKKAAGYFSAEATPTEEDLTHVVGRDLKDF